MYTTDDSIIDELRTPESWVTVQQINKQTNKHITVINFTYIQEVK